MKIVQISIKSTACK